MDVKEVVKIFPLPTVAGVSELSSMKSVGRKILWKEFSNIQVIENNRHLFYLLGHAVGFGHEQNRPDRDRYIKVRLENVPESMDLYHVSSQSVSRDYLFLPRWRRN